MKNTKLILGLVLLAVIGVVVWIYMKGRSAVQTSKTASTGTFSGFDNFFSGIFGKPTYSPSTAIANAGTNISGIINASGNFVNQLGSAFKSFGWGSSPAKVTAPAADSSAFDDWEFNDFEPDWSIGYEPDGTVYP